MSNEVKKEKVQMDPKYIAELTVKLFATCVIVAGLLGVVNMVTAPNIAAINKAKTEAAMKAVVVDADNSYFSDALEISPEMAAAAAAAGGTVTEFYEVNDGVVAVGSAMKIVSSGSQGSIEMMVGLDLEGNVTGVSIVKHSETAGIGTKVMENEPNAAGTPFLDQFKGMSGSVEVGSNVTAITGATVSSKGVTAGVNAAIAAVNSIIG